METFELKSNYWEFIDGHGKEPDVDYEQSSLGRLIIAHPFLNACPHYIEFLKLHAGLTFEPIGLEDIIGTIWGIGTNIPHLLDDEGELMNKQWYHMADIYDAENYLTFSFSFDSTQTEECIYLSLDYNADYEGTKQKTISYLGSTEKLQSFGYQ